MKPVTMNQKLKFDVEVFKVIIMTVFKAPPSRKHNSRIVTSDLLNVQFLTINNTVDTVCRVSFKSC